MWKYQEHQGHQAWVPMPANFAVIPAPTMVAAFRADAKGSFHIQRRYDDQGRPAPYIMHDGQVLDFFDEATMYPHVGHFVGAGRSQREMLGKLRRLLHGWAARVRRARGLNQKEYVEWMDLGFNAFAEAYGEVVPLTFKEADSFEAIRREAFRNRFRWPHGSPNADFCPRGGPGRVRVLEGRGVKRSRGEAAVATARRTRLCDSSAAPS